MLTQYIESLIAFVAVILVASLVVTILTQMFVAVFNLRGKNLAWGLKSLFDELHPGHGDVTREIVAKILKHPLIARTNRRFASVIRLEELKKLLELLQAKPEVAGLSAEAQKWLDEFLAFDEKMLEKRLAELPAGVQNTVGENLRKAHKLLRDHLDSARTRLLELDEWFDNMSDRLSERFTLTSRIVSVSAALIVVLPFQFDSIRIMEQVYSDSELRSRIIANTDLILERSEMVLGERNIFDLAMDSLRAAYPDLPVPTNSFTNRQSAVSWLQSSAPDTLPFDTLTTAYDRYYTIVTKEKLDYLGNQALELKELLASLGLNLTPAHGFTEWDKWTWKEVAGMLISIGLLSLGAPFWFNILKNVVNLRSKVMREEEQEKLMRKLAGDFPALKQKLG